jgi:hypothetical protein
MNRWYLAITVALSLGFLLVGCDGGTAPEVPPTPALDQMPLSLASDLFSVGYELVGYHEVDADGDGAMEGLAVLTLRLPATESFLGDSYVMLFGQHVGLWSLNDSQRLDGVNATAELRDLTGDGVPELLVSTEEAETQLGDFVTPLRHTDHLIVFTYTPDLYLMELGTFSSSLAGVTTSHSSVGEWEGQPAIQTAQDLPPAGIPLWRPFRVETFAWDGQSFASVQVQEQRRISPIISWLVRLNGPWASVFLVLGGVLSLAFVKVARRLGLKERWGVLGVALLLVAGGIGLGLAVEWLCVPGLILIGLVGLGSGRKIATWLIDRGNQVAQMNQEGQTEGGDEISDYC